METYNFSKKTPKKIKEGLSVSQMIKLPHINIGSKTLTKDRKIATEK